MGIQLTIVGEKQYLQKVIIEFEKLTLDTLGLTHMTSHSSDAGDKPAVKARYYRYDENNANIIEHYVSEMLKNGITERTESLYCSPSIQYKKNNGKTAESLETWRPVINYHRLHGQSFCSIQLPIT